MYGDAPCLLNEEADAPPEDDPFLQTFYEEGWDGKTLNKKQVKKTAQKLFEKINPVLKEFTAPVSEKFKKNVFHFSGAKNYQGLKTLSQAAYDPKTGRKTSFKEFKAVAQKIDAQYNKHWLKTEQNFAYMSLLESEKWHRFEGDAMLEYQTQADGAVRDSHRAWHGVRKPKGDAFWQRCYPPNGWGCRCSVIETNDDKATPTNQTPPVTEEAVPQMFQTNIAEKGLVFPEKHPYFKMPAGVKKEVERQAEGVMAEKQRLAEENKKQRERVFKIVDKLLGGKEGIDISAKNLITGRLHIRRKDYKNVFSHKPLPAITEYLETMHENITNWEYIGYGADMSKHPNWHHALIYRLEYEGNAYYANVGWDKNLGERVYAIMVTNSPKMIEGNPENVKELLKKIRLKTHTKM